MFLKDDHLYEIYKNVISIWGKPIYIRGLNKKYHITSSIHVPINWDSPLFINLKIIRGNPDYKLPTQTYNIFKNLINKYLNLSNFEDFFFW